MLAVRNRGVDVVLAAALGAALIVLAGRSPTSRSELTRVTSRTGLSRLGGPAGRSDQAELLDGVALLGELGGGGVHPAAGEVVDLEALDDLPVAVAAW